MLFIKFQWSRLFGPEDDFKRFYIYRLGGHLGHETGMKCYCIINQYTTVNWTWTGC